MAGYFVVREFTARESTKTERARKLVSIKYRDGIVPAITAIVNALETETLKEDPDLR
ncbi:MAG: hypothetical protein WBE34_13535 [Candidatus Nitrosopolaris sp.]